MEATDTSDDVQPNVRQALERRGMAFKVYACDPDFADTANFCEKYGFSPGQAANCILVASKSEPPQVACCIVLATTKLDVNKKVCQLLGVKKASFASAEFTVELTGMQVGGVTPFGLPDMPIYIDGAVMPHDEVVLGGGNRSSKVLMQPSELLKLPGAQVVEGLAVLK
ncbi:MAG TPA: YbaK/EbsC family protein [Planktothrix sp.]|jgi:prolyl-tRNA editing enzyme YbaK/EbsC (Cys-tRNA(Pro) deacylase)